jgi:hypothetical protein
MPLMRPHPWSVVVSSCTWCYVNELANVGETTRVLWMLRACYALGDCQGVYTRWGICYRTARISSESISLVTMDSGPASP